MVRLRFFAPPPCILVVFIFDGRPTLRAMLLLRFPRGDGCSSSSKANKREEYCREGEANKSKKRMMMTAAVAGCSKRNNGVKKAGSLVVGAAVLYEYCTV